jgi:hypothetical protein
MKNRNETYILNANNKQKENETICYILHSNKYDTSIINICIKTNNKMENEMNTQRIKWAKFTYVGK